MIAQKRKFLRKYFKDIFSIYNIWYKHEKRDLVLSYGAHLR